MPWWYEVDLVGRGGALAPAARYAVLRRLAAGMGPDGVLAFAVDGRGLVALLDGPRPTPGLGRALKGVAQAHGSLGGARESTWVEPVDEAVCAQVAARIEARIPTNAVWSSRMETLGARDAGFLRLGHARRRLGRPPPPRWHALPYRPSLPRILRAAAAAHGQTCDAPDARRTGAAVALDLGHALHGVAEALGVGPRQARRLASQATRRGACRRALALGLALP